MRPDVRRYADVLYARETTKLSEQRRDELQAAKTATLRQGGGQLLSGEEVRRLVQVDAQHIGRLLAERLRSFRAGFEETQITPTDTDFSEIWQLVRETYDREVQFAGKRLRDYIKTRSAPDGAKQSCADAIAAAAARQHDAVMADWKVWREQAHLNQKPIRSELALKSPTYEFHPAIAKVSSILYADGHYKSAVLEAFILVINEVKTRSGVRDKDGDALMNAVFGLDKRTPIIKFNTLADEAEQDEHRGIFFLFKGMVSIRNHLAHSNVPLDSPEQAFEYLSLASLLMRLLERSHMG